MGIFDFFKKKEEEPSYDPLNMKITDLQKSSVFDYDMKTWIVNAVYEYDWGENNFTREYKINSGDDELYLSVDEDDDLTLSLSRKIKIRAIDEDLPEYIIEHEVPPKKLHFKGKTYYKDSECPGYFKDLDNKSDQWTEFIVWDYYDEDEKNIISIEQWGEREFEASYGKVVKEFEFSNILPGEE